MIRLVPVPEGWDACERHLIDWHGLEVSQTATLDADAARRLHAHHHRERIAQRRRHEHA